MRIEQVCYTRKEEIGWSVSDATEGVDNSIKSAFGEIVAGRPTSKTVLSLDFVENGMFLTKSVPAQEDRFGRDNVFSHGYYFSKSDFPEVFSNYKKFIAIDSFNDSADLPLVEMNALPKNEWREAKNINALNLMELVYEALLGETRIDVIVPDGVDKISALRDVLGIVYKYLPLELCKELSFSSESSSGLRKITIVTAEERTNELAYDWLNGEIIGVSNKYIDVVRKIVSDPDHNIELLRKYINNTISDGDMSEVYEYAFSYIILKEQKVEKSDAEYLCIQLNQFLTTEKYYSVAGAEHVAMLLEKIVSVGEIVPEIVFAKLLTAYIQTTSDRLKKCIADYIPYSYKTKCSEDDFVKFRALKSYDVELYKNVTVGAIKNGSEEFIKQASAAALHNSEDCTFITEECGAECAAIVGAEIAKLIKSAEKPVDFAASENAEATENSVDNENINISERTYSAPELIEIIIRTTMHKYTLDALVPLEPDRETVWTYLGCIFSDEYTYNVFKTLEKASMHYMFDFIVAQCLQEEDRAIKLMSTLHDIDNNHGYPYLEKKLYEAGNTAVLEKFYTEVLLERACSTERILELQKLIKALCNGATGFFDDRASFKYVEVAKKECKTAGETLNSIKRTEEFVENLGENPVIFIKPLKEYFWERFEYNQWNIDFDYTDLFIDENETSDNVKALQGVVEILRKQKEENSVILNRAISLLTRGKPPVDRTAKTSKATAKETNNEKTIDKATRDNIIRMLKNEFFPEEEMWKYKQRTSAGRKDGKKQKYSLEFSEFDMNMDLFLLMHYSNVEGSLDPNMIIPDVNGLIRYFEQCCHRTAGYFLKKEDIIVDLYQIIYNRKEESQNRGQEYAEALRCLESFINKLGNKKASINWKISKFKEKPDLSWISAVSLLVLFSYVFAFISDVCDTGLETFLYRIPVVILGIGVIASEVIFDIIISGQNDNRSKIIKLVALSVSGVALFIALIFGFSFLF